MWNRGLEALLTQHIKTTQMCLEEIVALKKKDNELTEQLIKMEGRIELGMEHAEMSNLELQKRIEDTSENTFVTKVELAGVVTRFEKERARDLSTAKVATSVIAVVWMLLNWFFDKGIIHV
jgi:hypothetical protein